MHLISQSLDMARIQRDLRREARSRVVVHVWSRWGDPMLAGALLALAAWAIMDARSAQPDAGKTVPAVAESRGRTSGNEAIAAWDCAPSHKQLAAAREPLHEQ